MAKGRLAHGDIGSLFVAGSAAVLGANLTLVLAAMGPDRTARILIWIVWPGLYAAYALTSGSNASPKQEALAPYLAAAINAFVYFATIFAFRLIWRQLTLGPYSGIKDSTVQGASDDRL